MLNQSLIALFFGDSPCAFLRICSPVGQQFLSSSLHTQESTLSLLRCAPGSAQTRDIHRAHNTILVRHGSPAQRSISPGITPMLDQHVAVSPRHIGRFDINPSLQKRDCLVHRLEVFGVLQGHQPELSTCLLRLMLQPMLIQCQVAQALCTEISLEGTSLVTPDLSRELIE